MSIECCGRGRDVSDAAAALIREFAMGLPAPDSEAYGLTAVMMIDRSKLFLAEHKL
jgi:hypothetical protein